MSETTRGTIAAGGAAAGAPYLELRGVTVKHADRTVVSGIDLALRPGEFVALLGPSGCGKSSLLHVLAGLAPVAGGTLRHRGDEATDGLRGRVRVGYVFQDHRLLPWRTVGQNIEIAMKAAGVPAAEWDERIERFLGMLRVAEHRGAWPMRLSGGQRQRVSIARALAVDPDVVLMDEPFSGLDEVTGRAMRQELTRLHEVTRVPTLFVTHSIREALFLADRVVILSHGPARVLKTLDVPLERPRRHEDPALAGLEAETVADVLREWDLTEGAAS